MIIKEREIAGKTMRLETGRVARQSNGSVMVTYGETTILAAVNAANEPREDIDFSHYKLNIVINIMPAGKFPVAFLNEKQDRLNTKCSQVE